MLPIVRTEAFVGDLAAQIRWYIEETDLDDLFAAEMAQRFAAAVEQTLEFLARTQVLDVRERHVSPTCRATAGLMCLALLADFAFIIV